MPDSEKNKSWRRAVVRDAPLLPQQLKRSVVRDGSNRAIFSQLGHKFDRSRRSYSEHGTITTTTAPTDNARAE